MNRLRVLQPCEMAGGEAGQLRARRDSSKYFPRQKLSGSRKRGKSEVYLLSQRPAHLLLQLLRQIFQLSNGIAIKHYRGDLVADTHAVIAIAPQTDWHFE